MFWMLGWQHNHQLGDRHNPLSVCARGSGTLVRLALCNFPGLLQWGCSESPCLVLPWGCFHDFPSWSSDARILLLLPCFPPRLRWGRGITGSSQPTAGYGPGYLGEELTGNEDRVNAMAAVPKHFLHTLRGNLGHRSFAIALKLQECWNDKRVFVLSENYLETNRGKLQRLCRKSPWFNLMNFFTHPDKHPQLLLRWLHLVSCTGHCMLDRWREKKLSLCLWSLFQPPTSNLHWGNDNLLKEGWENEEVLQRGNI